MIINDLFNNKKQGMAEDDDAVAAFLARGGEVQKLKPAKPRKGERWQGSAHIGAAGGRGTKGRVSGLGANTGKSGKPVVTAEQGVSEANSDTGVKWFDFATWVLKQGDKYKGFTTNHTVHQAAQKSYKAYVNSRKQGVAEEGVGTHRPKETPGSWKPAGYERGTHWAQHTGTRKLKAFASSAERRAWLKTKPQDVAEVTLGDYRKKATVNKAVAQANKFFDRDNAAKVAAADQTIAKREKGLARADARVKPYTPPAQDAEKMQRDLTAKYPNIDELVAAAEKRRDPQYDYAEGDAYYRGREAEQNYQKLKQIQRVIQGLNESQAEADGPKTKELGTGTGRINPATGRPWTPSELKAKYKVQATSEPTLDSEPPAPSPEPEPPIPPSPEDIRKAKQLAAARAAQQAMGDVSAPAPTPAPTPALAPAAVPSGPPGFNAGNLSQLPGMNRFTQQPLVAPKPTANYGPGPAGYKTSTTSVEPTAARAKSAMAAATGKTPAELQQEYYRALGLKESLTWSKNFDPGRSLYRQMKKES